MDPSAHVVTALEAALAAALENTPSPESPEAQIAALVHLEGLLARRARALASENKLALYRMRLARGQTPPALRALTEAFLRSAGAGVTTVVTDNTQPVTTVVSEQGPQEPATRVTTVVSARERILELKAAGCSQREIVRRLNTEGLRSPQGGRWHLLSVQRVLARES